MLMGSWGNDTFHGGTGGGWTDVIELQNADGGQPPDGWSFDLTSGTVESSGDGIVNLSDDATGTITLDDGSTVIFDGVEQIIW